MRRTVRSVAPYYVSLALYHSVYGHRKYSRCPMGNVRVATNPGTSGGAPRSLCFIGAAAACGLVRSSGPVLAGSGCPATGVSRRSA